MGRDNIARLMNCYNQVEIPSLRDQYDWYVGKTTRFPETRVDKKSSGSKFVEAHNHVITDNDIYGCRADCEQIQASNKAISLLKLCMSCDSEIVKKENTVGQYPLLEAGQPFCRDLIYEALVEKMVDWKEKTVDISTISPDYSCIESLYDDDLQEIESYYFSSDVSDV